MAEVKIIVTDVDDEVNVYCEGDTETGEEGTPAQHLAGHIMDFVAQKLGVNNG